MTGPSGPPLTREGEAGLEEFARGWVGQFDLGKPDQLRQYNEVVNAVAKRTIVLCREEVAFNQVTGSWIVFARWLERYYAMPGQVYQGAYRNAAGQLCYSQ